MNSETTVKSVLSVIMVFGNKFENDVIMKPFLRNGLLDMIVTLANEEVCFQTWC